MAVVLVINAAIGGHGEGSDVAFCLRAGRLKSSTPAVLLKGASLWLLSTISICTISKLFASATPNIRPSCAARPASLHFGA